MSLPGRNDPCHCGSGKKYKSCHWAADRAAAGARADADKARDARLEALGHPSDAEMRELYQSSTGRALPAGPVPEATRATLTDLWRQRKLADEALARLAPEQDRWARHFDAHPDEFEAVAADLGRDPYYSRFELTKANARKVRMQLGAPPAAADALREYAARGVALTLDDDDRANFREAVLARVPDLVDEGRLKEAYVLATCADRAVDPEAPVSPLLRDVVIRSVR